MKKYVSNSLKILTGCMVGLSAPTCFGLTSCSKAEAIEFANYESYMSDDLMSDLQSKYNIHFPNYTVAEMIPAKFEKFYDCAVPCGYELMALLRNGWLEKIDWKRFNVESPTKQKIESAEDAQKYLFINSAQKYDGIQMMNDQFTQYILEQPEDDPLRKYLDESGKFQILNYGVPYFAQSYMFAYVGDKLTFYHNNNGTPVEIVEPNEPTWADIFYTISPSNPKQDARFKNKKIGMVDDARSFHDICRIVETNELGESPKLDPVAGADISRVQQTMSHITGKFAGAQGSFVLNSDSAIVSRGLADRNGDQTAVLSWSGDTIYAAQGAEEFESFNDKNFHIQKASDASFDEIEYVVINNKNHNNTAKLNNIYEVVKQICLDGCDKNKDEICEQDKDGNYIYWAMNNWNTVMYTPMLQNIYSVVTDVTSKYWVDQMKESGYDEDTVVNLFIPILNGQIPDSSTHLYGKTLTQLQNSNNHWAWLEQRGKL